MEHSCHIMLFPFQWKVNDLKKKDFSKQISLKSISPRPGSKWKRASIQEGDERNLLFNEQNYFYEFTHDALYDFGDDNDESLIHHYERSETDEKEVSFVFGHANKEYKLHLKYLNLNIYATGVGVLSFYLSNETYDKPEDVLVINQFARRVYPLFIEDLEYRRLLPDFVRIEGLNGDYSEDFSSYKTDVGNRPASYVTKLIFDMAPNIDIIPVVDDRMFVLSWFKNNDLSQIFSASEDIEPLKASDFWYKYVFVQDAQVNCHNKAMRNKLIEDSTYLRWQGVGSIYGFSRNSFVYLTTEDAPQHLLSNFETEYVRMAEMVLVQRASVLRFSEEISLLSSDKLDNANLSKRVNSLRREFIRFVNQMHFHEVTAQEQGIDFYKKLYEFAGLETYVKKLDSEIEELDNYVTMAEERNMNHIASNLSMVASFFVPATVLSGIFGMNNTWANGLSEGDLTSPLWQNPIFELGVIVGVSVLFVLCFYLLKNRMK